MSTNQLDLILGIYGDRAAAQKDFDIFVRLAENGAIAAEGILIVLKDPEGKITISETHDHIVRRNVRRGAGAGLLAGLLAPPLIGVTVVGGAVAGGVVGRFGRRKVTSRISDKLGDALPAGLAGIVAIYDEADAGTAESALMHANGSGRAPMDKASPKALKASILKARADLRGE